ncbi:hypothetical protein AVEN_114333-1 [Araneus ventricosus]|uniref:Uncharacterized protein n=1 Tax=Araneus ventricosus TaxID=182803 RepID=A0A4Y2HP75_ARAVE|nr:hypothetical protein AVEN_114333-1 [Araneus ventricosus]
MPADAFQTENSDGIEINPIRDQRLPSSCVYVVRHLPDTDSQKSAILDERNCFDANLSSCVKKLLSFAFQTEGIEKRNSN